MQPSTFSPWDWRDPSALAGGYTQTTPSVTPPDNTDGGHDGPDAPGPGTPIDLVGYRVQATDGRIGTIDEASHEADARYLVVDTGPWILGHKVLLPAGTVARVDHLDRSVHVDRTRQEIRDAPPFDPGSAGPEYRERVGSYYAERYRPQESADPERERPTEAADPRR
ncbi:PRC-barrel domain-containing protein [Micromonospora sp. RHAY321]|uniref:PRC-barrel domain-containing protein n=1 Tax=Micromonospora sp. RHAY321 TaxID=2944807 RepID=UPI00207C3412|nr:PRC-barrel domain-containing protein [Micromonospora sp. RHAY321]MCO1596171.1 PRC-barrel domain-containing protein [Micromonospora sp. RHAY321]